MSSEIYLQKIPKVELHLHLEGSIQPATLLTLAQHNKVTLPTTTLEGLQQWFKFRDFPHFAEVYHLIMGCIRTAADYELITYELGVELARQQVRYAEVTTTPGMLVMQNTAEVYLAGLTAGRERVRHELGVEINWVFDIPREISKTSDFHKYADFATGMAIEGKEVGVVALGLGGVEVDNPPELFAAWFDRARAAGLHSSPHAGETVGPTSVWGALQALGAERIGHGIRSVEDSSLIEYLVAHNIALEVCPTSNLRLGVYPSYAQHPLPELYTAGVRITINSDDPALFNTTLTNEITLLHTVFGLDLAAIDQIILNGVGSSFLPLARQQAMQDQFRLEMAELRKLYLV
jgi:adenosine deaminase